ncbi:MAG: hypothetical protein JNJ40_06805 [Bacteroidia bacterium]|nr:hypothetical protein [Bacteroidia bacterium]
MENQNGKFLGAIGQRAKAETPLFFKKLRLAGLMLAAIGGVLVGTPVLLPALVIQLGGYMIVGGTVLTAASQVSVKDDK